LCGSVAPRTATPRTHFWLAIHYDLLGEHKFVFFEKPLIREATRPGVPDNESSSIQDMGDTRESILKLPPRPSVSFGLRQPDFLQQSLSAQHVMQSCDDPLK